MVIVSHSSVVDYGFDALSSQTRDCEIGICCFSAKHAELRRKSETGLLRIKIKWRDVSTRAIKIVLMRILI